MTEHTYTVVVPDGYFRRIASPQAPMTTTRISSWRLVAVKHPDGVVQRHLVGRANDEGRLSTGIQSLDLQTMSAVTESGRVYEVVGAPAEDFDATYLYVNWLKHGRRTEIKDLSMALVRLRRMRARPLARDVEST